jgi:hypothetical protein
MIGLGRMILSHHFDSRARATWHRKARRAQFLTLFNISICCPIRRMFANP